jgi:hypothetical protein
MASQSHKICVADSSSSRHLSQVGSSVNPILKRCPFRWQCPVSSPTTHLNWSLFNFNRSFVFLAEGPDISSFSCLSPVVDSQCFLCGSINICQQKFLRDTTDTPNLFSQTGEVSILICHFPALSVTRNVANRLITPTMLSKRLEYLPILRTNLINN